MQEVSGSSPPILTTSERMEDAFRFLFAQKSVTRTVVPPFLQNVSTGGVELGIAFRRPFSKNKKKNEKGGVFLLDISGNFSYNKTHRATLLLLHEGGFIMFRGVAQLVARLLWEQDVVGSSPATPTTRRQRLLHFKMVTGYVAIFHMVFAKEIAGCEEISRCFWQRKTEQGVSLLRLW